MHCPRCGQQQVSSETKFCSRCGFQLGLVAELLQHGGVLPQLAELYKGKSTFFTRKNGVVFSILWFIFFVMMTALFGAAGIEEASAASILFGIFSTIMLLIISLGFLKKTPKAYELKAMEASSVPTALHGQAASGALPPQQQQPAGVYAAPQGGWRTPDTGELVQRSSVIENTTKLLKQDEK